MRATLALIILVFACCVGCNSHPKRAAFNSLASTAKTVDVAMKAAGALYKAGKLTDADRDDILQKYVLYQAAANEALLLLEFDPTAATPPSVLALALSLITTINQFTSAP